MSVVKLARPEIQALSAYKAAAQIDDTVRLNANESPAVSPIGNFRRPLNRYPEVRPQRLQAALASRFGCNIEQLLVTRGSSEAIDLIIRSFCTAGRDNILTIEPSFSMYRHYADVQGAAVIDVETEADDDFRVDAEVVLSACNESTRIVFLCSPNNPTGGAISPEVLSKIIAGRDERSVVVVDEAYIEFGREASMIQRLGQHPNLVVLRTLSKALGFAGARCGALVAAADVVGLLNAVQAPYALATPVVECVEDVLASEYLALADKVVQEIAVERQRVMRAMQDFSFVEKIWPSDANFFLLRANNAAHVFRSCGEQGILLRHFGGKLSDCLRITVGSRSDNDCLLAAFSSLSES